ncbi:GrpB family protein, partial [Patescibacteria group bacterium]|nr:GrpB family protein [Patescibacteria group bacterium]
YKKYNTKYPVFFSNEKEVLKSILNKDAEIIHIGSTSILNVGGKEIIDIMIASRNSDINIIKDKLSNLNYEYIKKLSFGERVFFVKDKDKNNDKIRIHLHLTFKNSEAYKKALLFKNYLLNNKKLALEYQNFKKRAIDEAQGDYSKYRQIKNKYIDKIIKSI